MYIILFYIYVVAQTHAQGYDIDMGGRGCDVECVTCCVACVKKFDPAISGNCENNMTVTVSARGQAS